MAIAFRAKAQNRSDSSNSLAISVPTGTLDGDLIWIVAHTDINFDDNLVISGTGWNEAPTPSGLSGINAFSRWRQASSEPSSYTVSADTAGDIAVHAVTFFEDVTGGGDWTQEDSQFDRVAAGTSTSVTAMTGVADGLLLYGYGNDDNENASTDGAEPSGMTRIWEHGNAGAADGTIASLSQWTGYEFTGTGSISRNITWSGGAEELTAFGLIFSWAAPAGGGLSIPVAMHSYRQRRV